MISIAPIGRGLVKYLTDKTRPNYYFDGGESPGKWLPLDANKHLGVSGTVRREDLHLLTLGFDLQGRKLVQNAGKLDGKRPRHLGISCVCNADKLEHRVGFVPAGTPETNGSGIRPRSRAFRPRIRRAGNRPLPPWRRNGSPSEGRRAALYSHDKSGRRHALSRPSSLPIRWPLPRRKNSGLGLEALLRSQARRRGLFQTCPGAGKHGSGH